jgi:hypothetical protein
VYGLRVLHCASFSSKHAYRRSQNYTWNSQRATNLSDRSSNNDDILGAGKFSPVSGQYFEGLGAWRFACHLGWNPPSSSIVQHPLLFRSGSASEIDPSTAVQRQICMIWFPAAHRKAVSAESVRRENKGLMNRETMNSKCSPCTAVSKARDSERGGGARAAVELSLRGTATTDITRS